MFTSKINWKVFNVDENELESQLNRLSEEEYEIFTVAYTDKSWTIVTKKAKSPSTGKSPMGFSAR